VIKTLVDVAFDDLRFDDRHTQCVTTARDHAAVYLTSRWWATSWGIAPPAPSAAHNQGQKRLPVKGAKHHGQSNPTQHRSRAPTALHRRIRFQACAGCSIRSAPLPIARALILLEFMPYRSHRDRITNGAAVSAVANAKTTRPDPLVHHQHGDPA